MWPKILRLAILITCLGDRLLGNKPVQLPWEAVLLEILEFGNRWRRLRLADIYGCGVEGSV
jgi:hypothetical protein